jgi:hypothetical protein
MSPCVLDRSTMKTLAATKLVSGITSCVVAPGIHKDGGFGLYCGKAVQVDPGLIPIGFQRLQLNYIEATLCSSVMTRVSSHLELSLPVKTQTVLRVFVPPI